MRKILSIIFCLILFSLRGETPATALDLPLRTWVSRPLPMPAPSAMPGTPSQAIGSRGYGPSPFGSGAKHQRLVYNPDNGRQLWHAMLPARVSNTPIAYMMGGRQYLVFAADDTLYAYALPQ